MTESLKSVKTSEMSPSIKPTILSTPVASFIWPTPTTMTFLTSLKICSQRWLKKFLEAIKLNSTLTPPNQKRNLKSISLLHGEGSQWWNNSKNNLVNPSPRSSPVNKPENSSKNNAKSTKSNAVTQELPTDSLTSLSADSSNPNASIPPLSLNILNSCRHWPNTTDQNQDSLRDLSFSSTITSSVMHTLSWTIHSSKRSFSCNKLLRRKKEMTSQCSTMRLSSMLWNTHFHQQLVGDWVNIYLT